MKTDTLKLKLVRETWKRNREAIRELRQCHADSCGTTVTEIGMAGDKAICEMDAALAAEEPASTEGGFAQREIVGAEVLSCLEGIAVALDCGHGVILKLSSVEVGSEWPCASCGPASTEGEG